MSYSFLSDLCRHDKTKYMNEIYDLCLECQTKVCKHPSKYLIAVRNDEYQQELNLKMWWKYNNAVNILFCKICNSYINSCPGIIYN